MLEKIKGHINLVTLLPLICLLGYFILSKTGTDNVILLTLTSILLGAAVMSSVHHAEEIAHQIGEGLGALLLALSVTIIEVGLIVSLMTPSNPDASIIARDTVLQR